MLEQQRLIARVRELAVADERLDAVLMYGSIAQGRGDAYSDIEFWLFSTGDDGLDGRAWCAEIGPQLAITVNEFGAHVVFFPGLIRGEFHFAKLAELATVATWPAMGAPVDAMIVVDRRGELRERLEALPAEIVVPASAAEIEEVCLRYANWLVLALNVAARGETQRVLDALGHVRWHLLWMARLADGATSTWLTPSRRAEQDLPPDVLRALGATAAYEPSGGVLQGCAAAWDLGRTLWSELARAHGFEVPAALWSEIDARLADHEVSGYDTPSNHQLTS